MPTNPFAAIEGPVRDLHQEASWAGRVYTQHREGETAGGRAAWSDPDTQDASIRIEWPQSRPNAATSGAGQELEGDAVIQIDASEVAVSDGSEMGGAYGDTYGTIYASSELRASIIEDLRNGKRYRVLRVRDENYGILTCDVETTDWTHEAIDS